MQVGMEGKMDVITESVGPAYLLAAATFLSYFTWLPWLFLVVIIMQGGLFLLAVETGVGAVDKFANHCPHCKYLPR